MSKIIKISFLALALVFSLSFIGRTLAQETSPEIIEAVNLDENVQPEDLEVIEPTILPDNPLYFLKNWGREIRSFFTFNRIGKAELRAKFANERLIELKKMIDTKRDPEAIKGAADNYQKEVEKIKQVSETVIEKAEESPQVEKFLDKFVKQQVLHQRLLQKLESQVSSEALEKIKAARERHLERFGEVMTKLEDRKEKIRERLDTKMEEIKGSKYKNFKNLEVLLELKEKVPEKAKEAIQQAQENALKRLKGDLEGMSTEDQERFKEYLEKISGIRERQLEIIENLKFELEDRPNIRETIIQIREGIIETVEEKNGQTSCPPIEKPALDFCKEGRIVIKKDAVGCIISFNCVIPAEVEILSVEKSAACITLWDPVCGKDGKTYSNSCFAKLAGVEIAYSGKCREIACTTNADCPQLKCGPTGTLSANCIDVKAECIAGKCQIQAISLP